MRHLNCRFCGILLYEALDPNERTGSCLVCRIRAGWAARLAKLPKDDEPALPKPTITAAPDGWSRIAPPAYKAWTIEQRNAWWAKAYADYRIAAGLT